LKLVPENSPWPRLLGFPLFAVVIYGMGMARFYPDLVYRLAYCPLRETTGIPCLTCGGTHSIVALMEGHFLESLLANTLVFLGTWIFFLGLFMLGPPPCTHQFANLWKHQNLKIKPSG